MSLPVAIFLLAAFSLNVKAQTRNQPALKNKSMLESNSTHPVDHVEVHGQTGIGDTAVVYFKNGSIERYVLNNSSENKLFHEKYGAILKRQAPPKKQGPEKTKDHASVDYEPLHLIPETISEITFGENMIWLKRKDGIKEQYDLRNVTERNDFEAKYGKLNTRKES